MARVLYRHTIQTRPYEAAVVELELGGSTMTLADLEREATPQNLQRLARVYEIMSQTAQTLLAQERAKG